MFSLSYVISESRNESTLAITICKEGEKYIP
jgi:hypothetical protein